jgi:hypothetical protein
LGTADTVVMVEVTVNEARMKETETTRKLAP